MADFVPKQEEGEEKDSKYYFWCNECRETKEEPEIPNWQDIVF